ncbi:hypothetical protein [Vulcanisaeta souniana]|nr:hypothetical protein [Vulcanisaeta souniana]BDR93056.1 hypothetical protein Vsou_21490 [Vulcanisaeta souniana JCM 11219]GGI83233.1 hypothetical protein GCM10007112_20050 [Vulcanisaeta souniana JCM 11219]
MSGAPGQFTGFNAELLRRNRFCMGVKRGREYVCSGEAGEDAVNKAVDFLVEAINRIQHWRVWETWWIEETMDEWLEARDRLEVQLRGKYSEDIVNAITGLVDKFINYNERFLNYWRDVGNETRRLIDNLMNGRAEVIIRGEGASGISVHSEHITLETDRTSTSIPVHLVLKGLEGVDVEVPDFMMMMNKEEYTKFVKTLRSLRIGFAETDESVEKGRPVMGTNQTWQVIFWSLLYPGEIRVHINTVNVNVNNMTVTWYLRSSNHKSLKGKIKDADVDKFSDEEVLALTLTAVLGDGSAYVSKNTIKIGITMSGEKFEAWEPLLQKLKKIGFDWGKPALNNDGTVNVWFRGSRAIDLARTTIGILPPILRDVLDALGFEKWLRINEYLRRSSSSGEVRRRLWWPVMGSR